MESEVSIKINGIVTLGEVVMSKVRSDESDINIGVRVSGQADEIGWMLHRVRPGARVRLIIELPEVE